MDENFQIKPHGKQLKQQLTVEHFLPCYIQLLAFHGKLQEACWHCLNMKPQGLRCPNKYEHSSTRKDIVFPMHILCAETET
jgi:hypothetical protein